LAANFDHERKKEKRGKKDRHRQERRRKKKRRGRREALSALPAAFFMCWPPDREGRGGKKRGEADWGKGKKKGEKGQKRIAPFDNLLLGSVLRLTERTREKGEEGSRAFPRARGKRKKVLKEADFRE